MHPQVSLTNKKRIPGCREPFQTVWNQMLIVENYYLRSLDGIAVFARRVPDENIEVNSITQGVLRNVDISFEQVKYDIPFQVLLVGRTGGHGIRVIARIITLFHIQAVLCHISRGSETHRNLYDAIIR